MSQNKLIATPFVKWVGGKGRLLSDLRKKYPSKLGVQYTKYFELFVGGGAVLFDLLASYEFSQVIINDINPELINAYIQIQTNPLPLIENLKVLSSVYSAKEKQDQKLMYYEIRNNFNESKKQSHKDADKIKEAAFLIFLNKTCYNGLYRVNRDGEFNVPMGRYINPRICDEKNIILCSKLLKNVDIRCGDYKDIKDEIDNESFVYCDPPYRPISPTSSFTGYHNSDFKDSEQQELAKFILDLSSKGAAFLISNSDPKNTEVNDSFFDDLYKQNNIQRITVQRMIKGKDKRKVQELLITTYESDS